MISAIYYLIYAAGAFMIMMLLDWYRAKFSSWHDGIPHEMVEHPEILLKYGFIAFVILCILVLLLNFVQHTN